MIKVVEILPDLGMGGAERLVFDLLMNFNKENIDCTLIVLYDQKHSKYYQKLEKSGINIVMLGKKRGLDIKCFFRLFKILKKIKPDIIHSHRHVNLYLFPFYFLYKKQIGFHTVHTLALKEQKQGYRQITKWLFKHRKVFPVAIGESVKQSICREYRIAEESVPMIYNGIDLQKFSVLKKEHQTFNFISVGRMVDAKNHRMMLEAFAEIIKIHSDCRLILIGDGALKDELIEKTVQLKISEKVEFTGVISDVENYLAIADVYLSTSKYEGLPLSILEAMAAELPIIATKAGGSKDIVIDEKNGFLIAIDDLHALVEKMLLIYRNTKLLTEFGENSKILAKKYDISECVSSYEKLFHDKILNFSR